MSAFEFDHTTTVGQIAELKAFEHLDPNQNFAEMITQIVYEELQVQATYDDPEPMLPLRDWVMAPYGPTFQLLWPLFRGFNARTGRRYEIDDVENLDAYLCLGNDLARVHSTGVTIEVNNPRLGKRKVALQCTAMIGPAYWFKGRALRKLRDLCDAQVGAYIKANRPKIPPAAFQQARRKALRAVEVHFTKAVYEEADRLWPDRFDHRYLEANTPSKKGEPTNAWYVRPIPEHKDTRTWQQISADATDKAHKFANTLYEDLPEATLLKIINNNEQDAS